MRNFCELAETRVERPNAIKSRCSPRKKVRDPGCWLKPTPKKNPGSSKPRGTPLGEIGRIGGQKFVGDLKDGFLFLFVFGCAAISGS